MPDNKNEEEVLPEYIQKYVDAVQYEGYPGFVGIAKQHKQELIDYDELVYPRQQATMNITNRISGDKKKVDRNAAIQYINTKYETLALEHAKQHGYVEQQEQEQAQGNTPENSPGKDPSPSDGKTVEKQTGQSQIDTRTLAREKFLAEYKEITERSKQHGKERS